MEKTLAGADLFPILSSRNLTSVVRVWICDLSFDPRRSSEVYCCETHYQRHVSGLLTHNPIEDRIEEISERQIGLLSLRLQLAALKARRRRAQLTTADKRFWVTLRLRQAVARSRRASRWAKGSGIDLELDSTNLKEDLQNHFGVRGEMMRHQAQACRLLKNTELRH
jgi:hypothetical protein